jgi:hypothetical protein
MTAHQLRRAPWLVGLAPILFLLALFVPAPLPASAAGGPPTQARHVPDGGVSDDDLPVTYRAQPGDSLASIARRFGTQVEALQQANRMDAATPLLIGQRLTIPVIPAAPPLVQAPDDRRGLAMALPRLDDAAELGVAWYYTWQWCTDPGCVPMVYKMEAPAACAPIILVGNEPNAIQPSGWPVSPTLAAERVRAIEVQCPQSKLVVGNVAADDWSRVGGWGSGRDWLRAFLAAYAQYARRNFHQTLGVHCYSQANASYCLDRLSELRAVYAGPMWVTEFGILSGSPAEFGAVLRYVSAYFDRFAAYTNRQPHTGQGWELTSGVEMVNGNGSLTPVGDVYAQWPRLGRLQMR